MNTDNNTPKTEPEGTDEGRSSPAIGSIVPFADARVERIESATLVDGLEIKLEGDRSLEVWRIKDRPGYAIYIYSPTEDGKKSQLLFGLSPEAAKALNRLLSRHLSNT